MPIYTCSDVLRAAGATTHPKRTAAVSASAEIPISTRGYPNCAMSIPAPAVEPAPTSALQNIVIADAELRSLSGTLLMSKLYSPGELIHCVAEKLR